MVLHVCYCCAPTPCHPTTCQETHIFPPQNHVAALAIYVSDVVSPCDQSSFLQFAKLCIQPAEDTSFRLHSEWNNSCVQNYKLRTMQNLEQDSCRTAEAYTVLKRYALPNFPWKACTTITVEPPGTSGASPSIIQDEPWTRYRRGLPWVRDRKHIYIVLRSSYAHQGHRYCQPVGCKMRPDTT